VEEIEPVEQVRMRKVNRWRGGSPFAYGHGEHPRRQLGAGIQIGTGRMNIFEKAIF